MFISSACKWNHFSPVQLFVTLWTVASQAPLFMDSLGKNTPGVGFHVRPQGIFLGIKPPSPELAGRFFTTSATTVIVINSPIPVHFSLLIPRMSTFTLAISCLTTSYLP